MRLAGSRRKVAAASLVLVAACSTAYQADPSSDLPPRGDAGISDAPADNVSFSYEAPDGAVVALEGGNGDGTSSGNPADAQPTPPPTRSPGKIECGGAQCTGGVSCCVGFPTSLTCGGSCSIFTINCDEPADCAGGNRCCASSSVVTCKADCGSDYTVCVSDADCDAGKHCSAAPSPIPPPYQYCQ